MLALFLIQATALNSAHSSSSTLVIIKRNRINIRQPWARVTKSKPKRVCIELLQAIASTRLLLMAKASTRRASQFSKLFKLFPSPRLLKTIATLDGATTSDNCVNTMYSSATVSCHNDTLPTPSSHSGLVISALDTYTTRKKHQILV